MLSGEQDINQLLAADKERHTASYVPKEQFVRPLFARCRNQCMLYISFYRGRLIGGYCPPNYSVQPGQATVKRDRTLSSKQADVSELNINYQLPNDILTHVDMGGS